MFKNIKFKFIKEHPVLTAVIGILTVLISGGSLYYQYRMAHHDLGGMLKATFHTKPLSNKDTRTIVVCVDDMEMLNQNIYITPTFDNPDQYSLRDFSLTYEVVSDNVELYPTDFVTRYHYSGSQSYYQYKDNILQAHMDTKNPFNGFGLKNDVARCAIISKVTYDGAVCLFEYRSDIWFFYLPKNNNISFDYWKLNCKQKIFKYVDEKEFDVYYITKDEKTEYQFDVVLGMVNSGIDPLKVKEKKVNPQNSSVTIQEYDKEREAAGEMLKIDDYIIERSDTNKIIFSFNRPAEKKCKLLLEYCYDHKGGLFPLFDTRYRILDIEEGQTGFSVSEPDNPKRIGFIKIYYQVNTSDYCDIIKNNKGSLEVNLKKEGSAIILTKNDRGDSFIKKTYGYSGRFDEGVTMELFFYQNALERYMNNHPLQWLLIFILFLMIIISIGPLIWEIAGKVKDEKVSGNLFFVGLFAFFAPFVLLLGYGLFFIVKVLIILI